jgi:carbonic anhydrase/acetyltransferase-like protein (isoleucine patch superfamily)
MKTAYAAIAFVLMTAAAGSALAEGSKIEKSTLINASQTTNSLNAAIGENASANTGSIVVKGSKVEKSTLINASTTTNSLNAAIGKGASANTGSIVVE